MRTRARAIRQAGALENAIASSILHPAFTEAQHDVPHPACLRLGRANSPVKAPALRPMHVLGSSCTPGDSCQSFGKDRERGKGWDEHDLDVVDSSNLGKKGVKVRENLTMREVHFPVGGDNLFFA